MELLGNRKNENPAETKKIQLKDRNGPTLEQDLSSLLVQQLIQENDELKKKMQRLSQSRLPQQDQQVQSAQAQDELDTSSWESVPSRMTPTIPRNCPAKDIEKVTPGGTKLPEGTGTNATAYASGATFAMGKL